MSRQRDPFADFARMRREMDQLLGDLWEGSGVRTPRRLTTHTPRADVSYCGIEQPDKAIVRVELPGVEPGGVSLEVRGRTLIVSGERPVPETEGRTYQQVELPSGPFHRAIKLSVDVVAEKAQATYDDGILTIELPVKAAPGARQVPIERAE